MTAPICIHCDKPIGDTERADNHPMVRQWSEWIVDAGRAIAGKVNAT